MTNRNGIWYEPGRTARYGGESDDDDGARILGEIVRNSTQRLQLSYECHGLHLQRSANGGGGGKTWSDLDKDNWTNLVPKMSELVRFEVSDIGWTGRLNTRTERLRNLADTSPIGR